LVSAVRSPVRPDFPYGRQLSAGAHRTEISEDYRSRHLWLSDSDGGYHRFPVGRAGPLQLGADHCHRHDMHQCLSGRGGRNEGETSQ